MAGIYRQRHLERTIFYRVLFHYFEKFLSEYEDRFEREYGYFRPVIQEVVEKYLDCSNPKCGFARIRCGDCGSEFLLHFSCKKRGFCPSCHAKRVQEWGEWMREKLLLDVPHRQIVLYYGLYSNAHRGKKRKAGLAPSYPPIIEDETSFLPSRGWAEMIRKVYEVDPLLCPHCGGRMRVIAFIQEHAVIDKIINHLKLIFHAERPPPPQDAHHHLMIAAEERAEYF